MANIFHTFKIMSTSFIFWLPVIGFVVGSIILVWLIYRICTWSIETDEVRAILKARGEKDRVLTHRERKVRRKKRAELRREYVSQYWVRNGCEPYDYQITKYLNDWEVNAETPYLEGIKTD